MPSLQLMMDCMESAFIVQRYVALCCYLHNPVFRVPTTAKNYQRKTQRVWLELKVGVDAKDYSSVAKREHLEPIEVMFTFFKLFFLFVLSFCCCFSIVDLRQLRNLFKDCD